MGIQFINIYFIRKFILLILLSFPSSLYSQKYVYTNNADFDKGILIGLEHDTTPDQLQLTKTATTFPLIWVPNSNEGTVSKVDTRTGDELGRYRTGPISTGNPSRTTLDIYGNCWVGNRATGTAVKIGLFENGQYIDRNNNGIIETSLDLNNDGNITGHEILSWGEDECVLYEIILITGKEGTYYPGEYKGEYANDSWNPGPRGLAIDRNNNIWVGTYGSMKFYHINGSNGQILKTIDVSSIGHTSYGAIIDKNGILWSSGQNKNHILRLNPSNNSFVVRNIGHFVYGLGIDQNNHLFISGWDDSKLTKFDANLGTVLWTKGGYYKSRGVAVTDDGDVWVANSQPGTVTRWSNDGNIKANIFVGNTPTGVAVDSDGKVWVVNNGDEYIKRIDPINNAIDLSKRIIGGNHYGYSDMTGIIARTITTKIGTWTVMHDSEIENANWRSISWTCYEPENTLIQVKLRFSNDMRLWTPWDIIDNGVSLLNYKGGRYLEIQVNMQILSGDISPILYDLSIISVSSKQLIIQPNPFSPNNDGFNDEAEFLFPGLLEKNYSIRIFDYNGREIAILYNENKWNGRMKNGMIAKPGAYFCLIKVNNKIITNGIVGLVL